MKTRISSHYDTDHRHFNFIRNSGLRPWEIDEKPVIPDKWVVVAAILCFVAALGIVLVAGSNL